ENEEEKVPDDLSHLRLDTLKSRLDEAVREENYELASRLRDEIKRRENKS
ncbi:MAG TPA: UvrB/UvrC motif-containing protein, partial [Salinivirgaceae bacterium]|nr:UvrB/UvrC motif-containing protein [Salinivirgaceae bacterium]